MSQKNLTAVEKLRELAQKTEDMKEYPARVMGLSEAESLHEFTSFDPYNEELKRNLELCRDFVSSKKKRLILVGKVGNGKTHLAVSVMKTMPKIPSHRVEVSEFEGKYWLNTYRSAKGKFITASHFFDEFEDARINGTKLQYLYKITSHDILCLDDLKLSRLAQSEARIDNLYLLVNELYRRNKRLILTMNFDFKQLWEIDDSIADRLRESSEIIIFQSESYRGKVR